MADVNPREAMIDPLFNNNPIALQVLGICSARPPGEAGPRHGPCASDVTRLAKRLMMSPLSAPVQKA